MPRMEETGGPLVESVLQNIVAQVGERLPDSYSRFLSLYNGGYPVPDAFDFANGQEGSSVQHFHSGTSPDSYANLLQVRKTYEGRIPRRFLAVATDPGGNQICLALRGPDAGSVYFWDHELEGDGGAVPDERNMTLIAHSFDAFLEGLHELA